MISIFVFRCRVWGWDHCWRGWYLSMLGHPYPQPPDSPTHRWGQRDYRPIQQERVTFQKRYWSLWIYLEHDWQIHEYYLKILHSNKYYFKDNCPVNLLIWDVCKYSYYKQIYVLHAFAWDHDEHNFNMKKSPFLDVLVIDTGPDQRSLQNTDPDMLLHLSHDTILFSDWLNCVKFQISLFVTVS